VKYELGVYVPEDGILHSHRRENLKSYMQFRSLRKKKSYCAKLLPQVTQYKETNTPWLLFRKRTIPTERPPLVGEF
jgi:hypothetical protein